MALVSTSGFWGGLADAIGSGISSVGSSITGLVQGLAPLAGPALGLAGQIIGQQRSQAVPAAYYGGGGVPNYTTSVMPGGALVPYQQAGIIGDTLGNIFGPSPGSPLGNLLGTGAPSPRMARTIQVNDAKGRPRTYVLAPAITPRYRVTMSTGRRRRSCSRRHHAGGR